MRALGHLFLLAAIDLARSDDEAGRRKGASGDELTAAPSREGIARAWRSWGEADPTQRRAARRGLALPAPRAEI